MKTEQIWALYYIEIDDSKAHKLCKIEELPVGAIFLHKSADKKELHIYSKGWIAGYRTAMKEAQKVLADNINKETVKDSYTFPYGNYLRSLMNPY